MPVLPPRKESPQSGHSIKTLTRENVWYATVVLQTSATEYSAPYIIEAPSQTMLLELIRMVLRVKERSP